jgi:Ser/Thr protein kinase RdoA (MazF antagonist)
MANASGHPFDALTPETLLDAMASAGFESDGRLLALNSFENRVYQIGLEDGSFVVAKFYRPQRWSDAAIVEEHAFTHELVEAELAVVAPLVRDGTSLFHHANFRFAVFPRRGGRAPELEGADNAAWMGRTLARLHLIGQRSGFRERGTISVNALVREPMQTVLRSALLPPALRDRYRSAVLATAGVLDGIWRDASPRMNLRLHGDCHGGNVLWTESGPVLVDFDDARSGPAVQDLWMLLDGNPAQRDALLDGYTQFREFDYAELSLIEPLRLMRQIHYAGWLAQRWDDPAFPRAFPWAGEARYWETHLADIQEALERL